MTNTSILVINLGTLITVLILVVRVSFWIGKITQTVADQNKDTDGLGRKLAAAIIHTESMSKELLGALQDAAGGLVTQTELTALLKHYDHVALVSESERKELFQQTSDLEKLKQDKTECRIKNP